MEQQDHLNRNHNENGAAAPPTLYRKAHSGRLQVWSTWSEGSDVLTEFGTLGGAMQLTRKTIAKRGRAGTTREQAGRVCLKAWGDKISKDGYARSESEAAAGRPFITPMLAGTLTFTRDRAAVKGAEFPVMVQPKLDGFRCMATLGSDGGVSLVSRNNLPFRGLSSIKRELRPRLRADVHLDGEIYMGGLPFEKLSGLIKRAQASPDVDPPGIEFHVFDCLVSSDLSMPFERRLEIVRCAADGARVIVPVPTYEATSVGDIDARMYEFITDGYEGLVARVPGSPYEPNKRARSALLKYKEFKDAEFTITGFREATGSDAGTVVWECVTEPGGSGQKFTVRPRGTRAERAELLRNASDHVGKRLTVVYQEISDATGVPRFPVGKAIRDVDYS